MGKREVITRFVILGGAVDRGHGRDRAGRRGRRGRHRGGVAVLLLLFVAWSAFTPNARLFGRVIGRGTSPSPKVAITFDDGPSLEHTPAVLDALRAAGATCTFFVLGRHVRAHPEHRPPDRGRGARARQPRRRPLAAHVRRPGRDRPPVPGGRGGRLGCGGRVGGAAVPRAARLPRPVPRTGGEPARLSHRRLDRLDLRHRPARRRGDRRPLRRRARRRARSCCCTTATARARAATARRPSAALPADPRRPPASAASSP